MKHFFLSCLLALATTLASAQQWNTNLLGDPTFTFSGSGWTTAGTAPTVTSGSLYLPTGQFNVDQSVKISTLGFTDAQLAEATAVASIHVARGNNVNPDYRCEFCCYAYDADRNSLGEAYNYFTIDGSFADTTFTLNLVVPIGTAYLNFYFYSAAYASVTPSPAISAPSLILKHTPGADHSLENISNLSYTSDYAAGTTTFTWDGYSKNYMYFVADPATFSGIVSNDLRYTSTPSVTLTGFTKGKQYVFMVCPVNTKGQVGDEAYAMFYAGIPEDACSLDVTLGDSYGDGWNGAKLLIASQLATDTFTLINGSEKTFTYFVQGPVNIEMISTGRYSNEVSFQITSNGTTIAEAVQGSAEQNVYFAGNVCNFGCNVSSFDVSATADAATGKTFYSFTHSADSIRIAVFERPASAAQIMAAAKVYLGDEVALPSTLTHMRYIYVIPFCGGYEGRILEKQMPPSTTGTMQQYTDSLHVYDVTLPFDYSLVDGDLQYDAYKVIRPFRFSVTKDTCIVNAHVYAPTFGTQDPSYQIFRYNDDGSIDYSAPTPGHSVDTLIRGTYLVIVEDYYCDSLRFAMAEQTPLTSKAITFPYSADPEPFANQLYYYPADAEVTFASSYSFTLTDSAYVQFSFMTSSGNHPYGYFYMGDSLVGDADGTTLAPGSYTCLVLNREKESGVAVNAYAAVFGAKPLRTELAIDTVCSFHAEYEEWVLDQGRWLAGHIYSVVVPAETGFIPQFFTADGTYGIVYFYSDSLCQTSIQSVVFNEANMMDYFYYNSNATSDTLYFYLESYNPTGSTVKGYLRSMANVSTIATDAYASSVGAVAQLPMGPSGKATVGSSSYPVDFAAASASLVLGNNCLLYGEIAHELEDNFNLSFMIFDADGTFVTTTTPVTSYDPATSVHTYAVVFPVPASGVYYACAFLRHTAKDTVYTLNLSFQEIQSITSLINDAPVSTLPHSCSQYGALVAPDASISFGYSGNIAHSALVRKVTVPAGDTLFAKAVDNNKEDLVLYFYNFTAANNFTYISSMDEVSRFPEEDYWVNTTENPVTIVVVAASYSAAYAPFSTSMQLSTSAADVENKIAQVALSANQLNVIGSTEDDVRAELANLTVAAYKPDGTFIYALNNCAEGWDIHMDEAVAYYFVLYTDLPMGYEFADGAMFQLLQCEFALTALEDLDADSESTSLDVLPSRARKFFQNGHIYIQTPDGKIYTVTGVLVK